MISRKNLMESKSNGTENLRCELTELRTSNAAGVLGQVSQEQSHSPPYIEEDGAELRAWRALLRDFWDPARIRVEDCDKERLYDYPWTFQVTVEGCGVPLFEELKQALEFTAEMEQRRANVARANFLVRISGQRLQGILEDIASLDSFKGTSIRTKVEDLRQIWPAVLANRLLWFGSYATDIPRAVARKLDKLACQSAEDLQHTFDILQDLLVRWDSDLTDFMIHFASPKGFGEFLNHVTLRLWNEARASVDPATLELLRSRLYLVGRIRNTHGANYDTRRSCSLFKDLRMIGQSENIALVLSKKLPVELAEMIAKHLIHPRVSQKGLSYLYDSENIYLPGGSCESFVDMNEINGYISEEGRLVSSSEFRCANSSSCPGIVIPTGWDPKLRGLRHYHYFQINEISKPEPRPKACELPLDDCNGHFSPLDDWIGGPSPETEEVDCEESDDDDYDDDD